MTSGRRLHTVLYCILASGLFFTAGEEISWGQRLFQFVAPAYFRSHNIQNETNIHNLGMIQSRMVVIGLLVGSYGSFAWLAIDASPGKIRATMKWFAPDWFLSSYFIPTLLLHVYFMLHDYSTAHGIHAFPIGGRIVYRDQEVTEFLQALGFLWFVVFAWRRQKKIPLFSRSP